MKEDEDEGESSFFLLEKTKNSPNRNTLKE